MNRSFCIYIMTNCHNTTLYTGVTSNLLGRVEQHRSKEIKGFTFKYNIVKLIYYEIFDDPESAVLREKQIKSWSRKKKVELIESMNPGWKDLYSELDGSEVERKP